MAEQNPSERPESEYDKYKLPPVSAKGLEEVVNLFFERRQQIAEIETRLDQVEGTLSDDEKEMEAQCDWYKWEAKGMWFTLDKLLNLGDFVDRSTELFTRHKISGNLGGLVLDLLQPQEEDC